MNQQVNQMQKEKSVKRTLIIISLLFFTCFIHSQKKLDGKYYLPNRTGDFYNYYIFKKDFFYYESGGHLGIESYGKGHYFIKNDSLVLNYDLTELKINDYHKYKDFINDKDSIKVKITIRDMNNKPLSDIGVLSPRNKMFKTTNKKGTLEYLLKKKKGKIELHVTNENLGYYLNIWTDRNYDITVFLRQDNYPVAVKNRVNSYKILAISTDSIKLQKGKHTILLKRIE